MPSSVSVGFALPEKLFDLFVFVGSEAVLPEGLRRKTEVMEVAMGKFYCRMDSD